MYTCIIHIIYYHRITKVIFNERYEGGCHDLHISMHVANKVIYFKNKINDCEFGSRLGKHTDAIASNMWANYS